MKISKVVIITAVIGIILLNIKVSIYMTGDSMEPNYHDQGLVDIPYITGKLGLLGELRNSVVVVQFDNGSYLDKYQYINGKVPLIKRVVGVPGDVVELKNNTIYINEKLISTQDDMPDGEIFGGFYTDNPGEEIKYTLGKNEYFVVGDNLKESFDSRMFGVVYKEDMLYYVKGAD